MLQAASIHLFRESTQLKAQIAKEVRGLPNEDLITGIKTGLDQLRLETSSKIEDLAQPNIKDAVRVDQAKNGEKKGIYYSLQLPDGTCYQSAVAKFNENEANKKLLTDLSNLEIAVVRGSNGSRSIALAGEMTKNSLDRFREMVQYIAVINVPSLEEIGRRGLGEIIATSKPKDLLVNAIADRSNLQQLVRSTGKVSYGSLVLQQMRHKENTLIDPTSEILDKALIITDGKVTYGEPTSGNQYIAVEPGKVTGEIFDSSKHSKGTFILLPNNLFITTEENSPRPITHTSFVREQNLEPDYVIPRTAAGATYKGKVVDTSESTLGHALIVIDGKVTHGNHDRKKKYIAFSPEKIGEGNPVTNIAALGGAQILFPAGLFKTKEVVAPSPRFAGPTLPIITEVKKPLTKEQAVAEYINSSRLSNDIQTVLGIYGKNLKPGDKHQVTGSTSEPYSSSISIEVTARREVNLVISISGAKWVKAETERETSKFELISLTPDQMQLLSKLKLKPQNHLGKTTKASLSFANSHGIKTGAVKINLFNLRDNPYKA